MPNASLKKHLRALSAAVTEHLRALDAEMALPDGRERGERIARLANQLDYANDRVRYFALGVDYRTDRKRAAADRSAERHKRTVT